MHLRTPSRTLLLGLAAACVLNACYESKSPDQVAKDTAAAETTGRTAGR
jgi:hypothetical protein